MNYKLEYRIPWIFNDFDNIKRFSLMFSKIPWLFPDLENRDNPVYPVPVN